MANLLDPLGLFKKDDTSERINARRLGKPRTDTERAKKHSQLYGTTTLPPRGTGLYKRKGI